MFFFLNFLIQSTKSGAIDCQWDNQIDLRSLRDIGNPITCPQDNEFELEYIPCGNYISCNINNELMYSNAMATQNYINGGQCSAWLAIWDDNINPTYEKTFRDEDSYIFNYFGGSTNNCGARAFEVTFICDLNAGNYDPNHLDCYEYRDGSTCQYYMNIYTQWACEQYRPTGIGTNNDNNKTHSGGWAFIGIVLGTLFLYCIIGYIYNGYKSKNWNDFRNNIPNYNFWKYIPTLTIEGCNVSFVYIKSKISNKNDTKTDELIEDID